jgi:hypothetical protein
MKRGADAPLFLAQKNFMIEYKFPEEKEILPQW